MGEDPAASEPAQDEVDRLVAAWRRELPDLDVEPLAVLGRVGRLARHLDLARRSAFGEHGLEAFEFDVLAALRRAGPPYELSPGELLTQTLVGSGTMTHRLDRLEQRGLIRRRPDPRDRRGVRVRLTARGRTGVDAAFADLLERERTLLAGLDDEQVATLAGLLRTLTLPFEMPPATRIEPDSPAAPARSRTAPARSQTGPGGTGDPPRR